MAEYRDSSDGGSPGFQWKTALKQIRAVEKPKSAEESTKEVKVKEVAPPLDFSFYGLSNIEEAAGEEPRVPTLGKVSSRCQEEGKSTGRCLRVNNNVLVDIKGLHTFVNNIFFNPSMIGWIDLSFNQLPNIDPVLLKFENLEILYLHANLIKEINEVDKLAELKNLKKLTLHGNVIENVKGYRMYVLSSIPWLRNFDFSAVTKCEARTAETWKRMNKIEKKKKTKSED